MNEYCNEGDKPIITYSFKGKEKRYKPGKAPITIETKEVPIEMPDNYDAQGYEIQFYSPNNFRNLNIIVLGHKIVPPPPESPEFGDGITWINCGDKDYQPSPIGIDLSTLVINRTVKCPVDKQGKVRCSIIVKHKGNLIFQEQGECPLVYSVQCGNCADGEIECKKPTYPGYCCIPCQDTASRIRNLGDKING